MNISKVLCISVIAGLLLGLSSQAEEYYALLMMFILVSMLFFNSVVKNSLSKRKWLSISVACFVSIFLFFNFEINSSARADSSEIEVGSQTKDSVIIKVEVEVGKTKSSKVRAKRVVVVGKLNSDVEEEREENIVGEK